MIFEFVMGHSEVFMSIAGRSRKMWLAFVLFYGIFVLLFNFATTSNEILIVYAVAVLNRMLPNMQNSQTSSPKVMEDGEIEISEETQRKVLKSVFYFMLYVGLFLVIVLYKEHIPPFGLSSEFLELSNYTSNIDGEIFTHTPHIILCVGASYYSVLTLLDVSLAGASLFKFKKSGT